MRPLRSSKTMLFRVAVQSSSQSLACFPKQVYMGFLLLGSRSLKLSSAVFQYALGALGCMVPKPWLYDLTLPSNISLGALGPIVFTLVSHGLPILCGCGERDGSSLVSHFVQCCEERGGEVDSIRAPKSKTWSWLLISLAGILSKFFHIHLRRVAIDSAKDTPRTTDSRRTEFYNRSDISYIFWGQRWRIFFKYIRRIITYVSDYPYLQESVPRNCQGGAELKRCWSDFGRLPKVYPKRKTEATWPLQKSAGKEAWYHLDLNLENNTGELVKEQKKQRLNWFVTQYTAMVRGATDSFESPQGQHQRWTGSWTFGTGQLLSFFSAFQLQSFSQLAGSGNGVLLRMHQNEFNTKWNRHYARPNPLYQAQTFSWKEWRVAPKSKCHIDCHSGHLSTYQPSPQDLEDFTQKNNIHHVYTFLLGFGVQTWQCFQEPISFRRWPGCEGTQARSWTLMWSDLGRLFLWLYSEGRAPFGFRPLDFFSLWFSWLSSAIVAHSGPKGQSAACRVWEPWFSLWCGAVRTGIPRNVKIRQNIIKSEGINIMWDDVRWYHVATPCTSDPVQVSLWL